MESKVMILGKDIFIDPELILITEDKIFINSTSKNGSIRVNFASCWNDEGPEDFIQPSNNHSIPSPKMILPPISFIPVRGTKEGENGFHLVLDFFNNDWVMAKEEERERMEREIPVPKYYWATMEEGLPQCEDNYRTAINHFENDKDEMDEENEKDKENENEDE